LTNNGHLPSSCNSDENDDEDEGPPMESIRATWSMDGATTLVEAAAKLREYADYLEELKRDGWELTKPVDDDWGFIENVDPTKRLSWPA
jgi:hypothetical protein